MLHHYNLYVNNKKRQDLFYVMYVQVKLSLYKYIVLHIILIKRILNIYLTTF